MTAPSAGSRQPIRLAPWSGRAPSLSLTEHQQGFFAPPDPTVVTSSPTAPGTGDPTGAGAHARSNAAADMAVDTDSFRSGYQLGVDIGSSLDFTVHIGYEDVTAVLSDPSLAASMSGSVMAPALGRQALTLTSGYFVLLDPDPTQVETSHMKYSMDVRSVEGEEYRVFGFKVIHEGPEWAAWSDSTTLYVTIHERKGSVIGAVIGRGVTRVSVGGFLDLLQSMRVSHVAGRLNRLGYKARFGRVLGRSLFEHYGGSFDEVGRFPVLPRVTQIPKPRHWNGDRLTLLRSDDLDWFEYKDGGPLGDACSRLIRYGGEGQTKGPVILAPGFGMPSWSLMTETIDVNLVEFLIQNRYEVWLFDYHSGSDLPSAATQFTLDQIADDWAHAIAGVLARSKRHTVQCVGHCVGSAGLLMAVLKGAPGVRSMVCGQYTLFPYASALNLAKNSLGIGELMDLAGITTVAPDTAQTVKNVAVDLALRPVPIPPGERCGLSVCRWINAIYGLTHTHSQFNEATHNEIGDIFGVGNLTSLRHILRTMACHRLVDSQGRDVYLTDDNVANLNMPVHFLAGDLNYIFRPKGSRATLAFLHGKNPTGAAKGYYTADFLPTYSHLDTMIGRNAVRDVYPLILQQLDRHEDRLP